jgi:hypothetical protein
MCRGGYTHGKRRNQPRPVRSNSDRLDALEKMVVGILALLRFFMEAKRDDLETNLADIKRQLTNHRKKQKFISLKKSKPIRKLRKRPRQ